MREKSIGKDPSKLGFGFGSLQEVTNRRDPLKRVAWIRFGFAGERRRKIGWLVFLVGVMNSCFAAKTGGEMTVVTVNISVSWLC